MARLMSFVFAACLLTIATSTGASAANPDWPKSLTIGTASPGGVYVVYGEELPEGEDAGRALADGFGAEPGDEVIELRAAGRPGELAVRRWRVGTRAAA